MLKILIKNTDYSIELENYLRDVVEVDLDPIDYIEIGYYKPFGDLYLKLKDQNIDLESVEYYSGSWNPLVIRDKTSKLKRSGFISWEKPENWRKTEIDGSNLFWIRFKMEDAASLEICGINLVFSDDIDLKEGYANINNFLPKNADSFIAYHQEAREYILTYLRNKGEVIKADGKSKLLDQYDLHNFNEIRQAAKYLALANIFFNESDDVDDKWYQKARDFRQKYTEAINLNFLSLDKNDDGLRTENEHKIKAVRIVRL